MAEMDDAGDLTLWTRGDGKSRAARTAEILLTLARFGLGEIVERAWWAQWLPGSPPGGDAVEEADADAGGAIRLRHFFEELGPSFVKIGQLLALHAGALPPAYRDELSRLLDNTLPLPFSVMEAVLSEELGADWHQFFQEIERQPLASASIGQVHTGVLQNGDRVGAEARCTSGVRARL
jgi:ubiquinone biosynthesis protein